MPIEFSCSQCNSELRVREEDVGKKARCPRCGMIHDVPHAYSGSRDVLPAEEETVYHHRQESPIDDDWTAIDDSEPDSDESFDSSTKEDDRFQISGYERWRLKTPDGQVYGPVDREELDSWKNEGRISAACLVQQEGESHWQSALVVYPDLAAHAHSSSSAHHAGHSYGHRQWLGTARTNTSNSQVTHHPRPNNGGAVLVMGILGLVFIFIPIFALIAWSMGYSERRAISRGVATDRFRWMVDTGYVLGIIGSAVGCLAFFSCCLRAGF